MMQVLPAPSSAYLFLGILLPVVLVSGLMIGLGATDGGTVALIVSKAA
jgi:hypothetical protein